MAYTKYSLTPANNNATPPDGAPEGMLPSAVNDTMRDMMAQIRDVGDGIRNGTYTMTAPVITGGSITGSTINNSAIGGTTANSGAFTTLSASGATTFSGATVVSGSLTANTFSSSGATITGGTINSTAIGGTTAAAGKFTTLEATGVTTVQAGTVSAPAITTTGDTNTGIFFPAADTIAFTEGGVESMRIDSSGNVGIGQSSPTNALDITRPNGTATQIRLLQSSLESWQIGMPAGVASLTFANSGTEQMRITTSGNVGIGTSSPSYRLDVVNSSATAITQIKGSNSSTTITSASVAGAALFLTNSNNTANNFTAIYGADAGENVTSGIAFINNSDANNEGTMAFMTRPSGGSLTERMRITSAGRVGIGTSSPASLLHVASSDAQITCSNADASVYTYMLRDGFYSVGGRMDIYTGGANAQTFWTNANERMRITSGGDVLVGTTADDFYNGSARGIGLIGSNGFIATSRDGNPSAVFNRYTSNGDLVQFRRSGTVVGTVSVTTTATAYNTSSDYRLKENIAPMTGALDKVAQLKPCTYTWKSNGSAGQGFIAHELQAVVPDAVVGEKDAVDEEGKPVYQGVDTSFLVATLTAAIQEQQAMIEELKQEIAALKSK